MKSKIYLTSAALLAASAISFGSFNVEAKRMSDLKIYINPGHGGYTSNDRPIQIHPYASNDSLGYWESKSNLYKGLHMYHILDSLGAKPYLSRIKNTEDDDRSLAGISTEANNYGVDLFFSIHSNAGENVNYPIMLYRENEIGVPRYAGNVTLSKILWKNLHSSRLSLWTRDNEYVEGDLTFYQNMWQGGLGVLRGLYTVGLLSEGGMHEHRPEAHRLMNDDFNWLEAWHFVKSIMEYYDVEDKFVTGNVAGVVYDDHNLREFVMPALFTMFGRDKNAPLNGSLVELIDKNGNVVQRRTTDNDFNGVYVFRNVAPGDYKVRTSRDGYHSFEKNVTVNACEVSYCDCPMSMNRPEPLAVISCSHDRLTDGAGCSDPLILEFNYDIDTEAFENAVSFEPAIDGYWRYSKSLHVATFRPEIAWNKSTHYKMTIARDACHTDKNAAVSTLSRPYVVEFDTKDRGKLEFLCGFPHEGAEIDYRKPTIEFRFDTLINSKSITSQIVVKDSKNNVIAYNSRNCSYNKLSNGFGNAVLGLNADLVVGENYTVDISGEITDKSDLPLIDNFVINFKAVDRGVEKEGSIVETFDAANALEGDLDGSKTVKFKPNYSRSTSAKLFGSASALLGYEFSTLRDGVARWSYVQPESPTLFYNDDMVGVHVNGDFNNHRLYVEFTSGADVKRFELGQLDFKGWDYLTTTLSGLIPEQGYMLSGFVLEQVGDPVTQKGSFNLDDIVRIEPAAVDQILADKLDAAPKAVVEGDILTIFGCGRVDRLSVYNPAGELVARAKSADTVSVADLAPGVYLVKIIGENNCAIRFVK